MKNLAISFLLILGISNIGFAQTKPDQIEDLLTQGEVYLEEYEFEKALAAANEALQKLQSAKKKSPAKLASVYFLYGKIYETGFYLDKAIESHTTALKFEPKNADIYHRRGSIYQYIGETEKADADFIKADDLINSGKISSSQTFDLVGTVGKSSPIEYPEVFQIIDFIEISGYIEGISVIDLNNDEKISDEEIRKPYISQLLKLNKLVEFNPKSDLALWKRGDLYLQINELSNQLFWISAVSDFTDAFAINPRFEYLNNRGVVRAKRDNKVNYEFAINDFTEAIQINNKSAKVFYNRGLSYLKLNEYEKSIADFTEVIKLDPGFVLAYKSRAKAFRAIGKIIEAEADEKIKRF